VLISQSLAGIGIHAAFSEAADGGVRDENDPLAEGLGWRAGFHLPLYQCQQLHGDDVWWVEWGDAGKGADILLSRQHKLTLAIRTADCLPILLADAEAGVIAAVHAGWRGTARNVAAKAITTMVAMGANPAHIHAALGPSIAPCCFTIGDDCREQLWQAAGGIGLLQHDQTWSANLAAINGQQLQKAGVKVSHIDTTTRCSGCSSGFFSHRRDQTPWRQLSLIGLT